jgi:hypothetical protein
MAQGRARSFCLINPGSAFDTSKFTFGETHVNVETPSNGLCNADRSTGSRGTLAAPLSDGQADAFVFDRVFEPSTSQETIFQEIARASVLEVLDHFTSAAFIALGASGVGKTFAVTGGAKRFVDRGLIPRSISALFEALSARPDRNEFEVAITFFEIYKDNIEDLLSDRRRQVTLQSSGDGLALLGLSKQAVATESDAYHLLFQGDSNRHFERFPHNAETSRGHVFYEVHFSHAPSGREATLSFIDLAASISTKNQVTASIDRSISAFRNMLVALHAGQEPDIGASSLTKLLWPWFEPRSGPPAVHVALINPIKFSLQMQEELHDWLQLTRLAGEVLYGLPSRLASTDPVDADPQTDSDAYVITHGVGGKFTGSLEEPRSPPSGGRVAADTSCCHDLVAEPGHGIPDSSLTASDTSGSSPGIRPPDACANPTVCPPRSAVGEWQSRSWQAAEDLGNQPTPDSAGQVALRRGACRVSRLRKFSSRTRFED